jgi:hypothetical protein
MWDLPSPLYHYTCIHGWNALGDSGEVLPLIRLDPKAAARIPRRYTDLARISWFTDLDYPYRPELGLTSRTVACDRTGFRYRAVSTFGIVPWLHSHWRAGWLRQLDQADGVLPRHWFVSAQPVPVVFDPLDEI